jgi:hypothetical protein
VISDAYLDPAYLRTVQQAHERLNHDADELEHQYLRRLNSLASPRRTEPTAKDPVRRKWRHQTLLTARFWQDFGSAAAGLLSQAWQLRPGKPSSKSALLVAISTRRLVFSEGPLGARQQLTLFAKQLGPGLGSVADSVSASEQILLVDVQPVSHLWPYRHRCWKDGIVIIDGVFACLYFVVMLVCRVRTRLPRLIRLVRDAAAAGRSGAPGAWRRAAAVLFYGVLTSAYGDLIQEFSVTRAISFASNSRIVETLRAYLIQSGQILEVVELMHGTGSIPAEELFSEHLSFGARLRGSHKHSFIPQIPDLPLRGVFLESRAARPRAINAYLNRYFVELVQSGTTPAIALRRQNDELISGSSTPNPLAIVMFGYPAYDGQPDTHAFQAETFLIERIQRLGAMLDTGIVMAYVPHPLCRRTTTREVLARNNVRIIDKPVPAWLLGDLCISLQSSAMFEAAHFGAESFTPMLPEDGLFSPAYLSMVRHPANGSLDALDTAMLDWLRSRNGLSRADRESRLYQRLDIMGWEADTVPAATSS